MMPPRSLVRLLLAAVLFAAWASPQGAAAAAPVAVNADAASDSRKDSQPTVAVDAANHITIAVWMAPGPNSLDSRGSDLGTANSLNDDLYYARSLDGGKSWLNMGLLKTNAMLDSCDDMEPSVAADGKGNWIVVWRSLDTLGGTIGFDADVLMTRSTDGGITWSPPAPVNADAASDPGGTSTASGDYDCHPHIFTDGLGHWMVSWVRYGASVTSAMVASSSDNGATWSAPAALQTKTVGSSKYIVGVPTLASDGQGRWIASWISRTSDSSDFDVYSSTSTNNGGAWSAPALLHPSFSSDTGDDNYTAMAYDGQGHWMAVWQSAGSLGGRGAATDNDILYSVSSDNGATWSVPAMVNTDANGDPVDDIYPRLVYAGQGKWVAAWVSTKSGGDSDVFYATLAQGVGSWTAPQTVNPWAASDSASDVPGNFDFQLASDGLGHWITVWSSNYDLGGGAPQDAEIFSVLPTGEPVPVELGGFHAE